MNVFTGLGSALNQSLGMSQTITGSLQNVTNAYNQVYWTSPVYPTTQQVLEVHDSDEIAWLKRRVKEIEWR